jgi:hypothetical protein
MTGHPPRGHTTSGLRRFREAEPIEAAPDAAPEMAPAPAGGCELCGQALAAAGHGHAVDLDKRGLLCVCRACVLLFAHEGAGTGRYRVVPERYRHVAGFALTPEQWAELQLPVGVAFFFRNSRLGRFAALYPSPGGAIESLLPLGAWEPVLAANPEAAGVADDVEALLLRRSGDEVECHLVPISACYDLVGRLRRHWRGFDGGARVREEMDAFFAGLRERGSGALGRDGHG